MQNSMFMPRIPVERRLCIKIGRQCGKTSVFLVHKKVYFWCVLQAALSDKVLTLDNTSFERSAILRYFL
jgi:hypothetical protein